MAGRGWPSGKLGDFRKVSGFSISRPGARKDAERRLGHGRGCEIHRLVNR